VPFLGLVRFPRELQTDDYSCGVCCVVAVLRHLGQPCNFDALSRELGANPVDGTHATRMVEALNRRGLAAGTYPSLTWGEVERALQAGGVVITVVDGDHVVVVHGLDDELVYLSDPSLARTQGGTQPRAHFDRRWAGVGIAVLFNHID
jgi:ABC-type bacteriocin/lantibiotic exporter with double-glycine peptidase domain